MIVGEVPDAVAFQIHHADHAVLHDQRHRRLRPDIGMGGDVARILGRVVHADGFARLRGGAGNPLAQRNVIGIDARVVADAEEMPQVLSVFVDQQNAEGVGS